MDFNGDAGDARSSHVIGTLMSSRHRQSTHHSTVSGTSAIHLVYAEINTVTSAIRRYARNAASSSFLGSASSAHASGASAASGPVPSGSSAASLLKNAVIAASSSSSSPVWASVHTAASASSNGASPHMGQQQVQSRGEEPSRASLETAQAETTGQARTSIDQQENGTNRLHYTYADGRRDDSVPSLLHGFTILRAQLRDVPSLASLPAPFLISPFLRVILSPKTTAPVTSIALQSLQRLIVYDIIKLPESDARYDEILASRADQRDAQVYLHRSKTHLAVAEIAHAVSHCRFEASEAAADELVLLRILAVMRELMCGEAKTSYASSRTSQYGNDFRNAGSFASMSSLADCLGDESICEMMETGLSMCCQMRLSDLLRRTAEQSMTAMVRALFARLATIPLASDEAYSSNPDLPKLEPEHATLAAEPVGDDALDQEREKRLRRMTMPDPKSLDVPAAGLVANTSSQESSDEEKEAAVAEEKESSVDERTAGPIPAEAEKHESDSTRLEAATSVSAKDDWINVDIRPYGLPAIKEVMRVIVSLLDPHNAQHTDSMRLLGLNILSAVFEVAGQSIAEFPSLRAIVQDSACKYLFELVRSDSTQIQASSLRTVSTLFECMRPHLKLQYELFISYLVDRLAPTFPISLEPWKDETSNGHVVRRANLLEQQRRSSGSETPQSLAPPPPPPQPRGSDRSPAHGEARELVIETLCLLHGTQTPRHDGIDSLVELYVNYDCDVDCDNLFEKFIHFLCRAVYASNPLHVHIQESTQLYAIDTILNFVGSMATRQENAAAGAYVEPEWPTHLPRPDLLAGQKNTKASLLLGADKFNAKPKDGLAYFVQHSFIENADDEERRDISIARFLKECPRLDKTVLGDFLSRPDNEGVLKAFLGLFDFSNTPIAEAMREMLEAFRLPGESQQISRITETFAKIFFASHPPEIKSEDAVYVLSYSIIMLNTDLHNPQNKRRMTIDDYRRNLRGVNDGTDFDPDFLGAIYDSIRRREIVMPEEHKGQLGFDYTWKELLRRSRRAGSLLCPPTIQFDRAIFEASWRPIVASIAHAFSTYRDEHIIERSISAFRQCAILASRFGMHDLFDYMIRSLANATSLLDASGAGVVTNNAVVDVENQQITVSPLSVQFGRNFKGQLAAVVLFTIASGNGNAVRTGWLPIFEIFKNLFINSLLAPSIGLMFEFGLEADLKPIPLKAKRPPGPSPQDPRAQANTGLFSTISSYLLSPYSTEREVARPDVSINEEAVESSLCTADCVASCRIEDLYAELMMLNADARSAAIEALALLAGRYTTDRQIRHSEGTMDAGSGRSTPVQSAIGQRPIPSTQYDAGAAFVLELATNLACSADTQEIARNWTILSSHITAILEAPQHFHLLQVERVLVALLRLVNTSAGADILRDQTYVMLDRVNNLPVEIRMQVAPQITAGLYEVIASTPGFAKSRTEWSLIYSLLSTYGSTRSASAVRFTLLAVQAIVQSRPADIPLVTQESFPGLVAILRDFAQAAEGLSRQDVDSPRPDGAPRKTLTEKKAIEEYRDACSERGPVAVSTLEEIRKFIPDMLTAEASISLREVWQTYWLPLMSAIAQQYVNAHRPTRSAALVSLPRILLAPEIFEHTSALLSSDSREEAVVIQSLFHDILFPMLHELLKPEVFHLDPGNEAGSMQEARIRACNLLCKVFLHYMSRLAQSTDADMNSSAQTGVDEQFLKLWMSVLDFFDRFLHSARRDALTEATAENLKNVLLVMNASGLLLPPGAEMASAAVSANLEQSGDIASAPSTRTSGQRQFFESTFERIHRFMPNLQTEIFPQSSAMAGGQAAR